MLGRDRAKARGDRVERLVPADAREAAFALAPDPPHRIAARADRSRCGRDSARPSCTAFPASADDRRRRGPRSRGRPRRSPASRRCPDSRAGRRRERRSGRCAAGDRTACEGCGLTIALFYARTLADRMTMPPSTMPRSASAPGAWASARASAPREVAALRAGLDLGMHADRHRRDVRRRRRRGNRRRSDRRAPRRRLPGQQVLSAQRGREDDAAACERSLAAPAHRSDRLLSAALARAHSAGGDGRRVRATRAARQDRALGRVELRRRRHGRAVRAAGRRALRGQPGSLSPG